MEAERTRAAWVCCHLGARRNYGIARNLHSKGLLERLITDVWAKPGNPVGYLSRSVRRRYHPVLAVAPVHSANLELLAFEILARAMGWRGGVRIFRRNQWFQSHVVRTLRRLEREGRFSEHRNMSARRVLHGFSYTALHPFAFAKEHGWHTVLEQIDAGPLMQRIEDKLNATHLMEGGRSLASPLAYWEEWRQQCMLADKIIVNSSWTRSALLREGIADRKIRTIPLSYAPPQETMNYERTVPAAFSSKRPMRVLFLGQVTLLKGVMPLLEAIDLVRDVPIELHVVGQVHFKVPAKFLKHPRIRWRGRAARWAVAEYYQNSDVFAFPTFCDGFGLTQLEAQAWGMPVIASKFCGDVVKDEVNGIRLSEVTAGAIATALLDLGRSPARLRRLAANSKVAPPFTAEAESDAFAQLFDEL